MLGPTTQLGGTELNVYAAPAILTLILLVAETVFLAVALPETRGKRLLHAQTSEKSDGGAGPSAAVDHRGAPVVVPAEQRIKVLKSLRVLHFLFLGLFSGVEFTLTFLTFDRT